MNEMSFQGVDFGTRAVPLGLDHVGLAIANLQSAESAFQRLGFRLSPISMHAGATTPGGPVVPWGSGNRCAMFKQGYLELLGLVDRALPSNVKGMLDLYEGLHIVALDCADAMRAHPALVRAGVVANAPVELERDATFGLHDESVRRAMFRNVYLDPKVHPEARFIVIEHVTRDVLWQEHLLDHPNGAQSLEAVYLVVPDSASSAKRLQPLLGAHHIVDRAYRFDLEHGAVWILDEQTMRSVCPVLGVSPAQRVAAACIAVRSLAALRDYLDDRDVPFSTARTWGEDAPCLWVGPAHASHTAIQFTQSTS